MTTHYNTSSSVTLRCDGDHEWGEPKLTKSSTRVVLRDGEICLKVAWVVQKPCQKDFINDVASAKRTCQKGMVVDNGTEYIPVSEIEE